MDIVIRNTYNTFSLYYSFIFCSYEHFHYRVSNNYYVCIVVCGFDCFHYSTILTTKIFIRSNVTRQWPVSAIDYIIFTLPYLIYDIRYTHLLRAIKSESAVSSILYSLVVKLRIGGRKIINLCHADDTIVLATIITDLQNLILKLKGSSEEAGLFLNTKNKDHVTNKSAKFQSGR